MTDSVYDSEAVLNGVRCLKAEEKLGRGSASTLAVQRIRTALMRDNERAARYWRKVLMTLRRLDQQTARTSLQKVA